MIQSSAWQASEKSCRRSAVCGRPLENHSRTIEKMGAPGLLWLWRSLLGVQSLLSYFFFWRLNPKAPAFGRGARDALGRVDGCHGLDLFGSWEAFGPELKPKGKPTPPQDGPLARSDSPRHQKNLTFQRRIPRQRFRDVP